MKVAGTEPLTIRKHGMSQTIERPKLSLAEVASTAFVERQSLFSGRSVIELNEKLDLHAKAQDFAAARRTGFIRIFTLHDVVLDGQTLILSKDGCIIPETDYFAPDHVEPTEPNAAPLAPDEVLVVACNNQHWGYQHWLAQCLPAIDWSLRHLRSPEGGQVPDGKIRLLLPDLLPWQEEYLQLLGCSNLSRLRPEHGQRYKLPRVIFCDYVNGSHSFEVTMSLMETIRRVSCAVPVSPSPDKILYVPHLNPYYGSMRNQDEAIALLREHGVRVLQPQALSVAERVNLFRGADVVIGPMGEHLADVLFCRPGALLWEWMPAHQQNAMFNRLAQMAQLHYRGDMFPSAEAGNEWDADLNSIAEQLRKLRRRPFPSTPVSAGWEHEVVGPPLEELLLRFESLGDNCEFGFVQRAAGADPLGLLRFNGIKTDPEHRLRALVAALERGFDGLGAAENIRITAEGTSGRRELIAHETAYNLMYHTWVPEHAVSTETQTERESKRLTFLRRKLMNDIAAGDKIFVWKSDGTQTADQVRPLFQTLRRFGPDTLLWVTKADADHPSGSVEMIEPDFIHGYVERFAPADQAMDVDHLSWFLVCQNALRLSGRPMTLPPVAQPPPVRTDLVPVPAPQKPQPALPSAMDMLARAAAEPNRITEEPKGSLLSALLRLFGKR